MDKRGGDVSFKNKEENGMRIVVLAGGLSMERNVSLSSGNKICRALRARGHQAILVDMFMGFEDYDGKLEDVFDAPDGFCGDYSVAEAEPDLAAVRASRKDQSKSLFGPGVLDVCAKADVVFLALHGTCGEDGRVQAAFDLLGIPYTGAGYLSSAIAMDKDLTKRLVSEYVITPQWRTVRYTEGDIARLVSETKLPCVVKPVAKKALEECLQFGAQVVLEQYISGREIQVGIIAGKALPSIEIIPKTGFYDYANKYQAGAAEEICPSPIPEDWEMRVRTATETVYRVLELSVYSRADFIVTPDGTPYFLEINTLPGMTKTSLLPQEAAAVGIGYEELCEKIVEESMKQRRGL